MDKEQKEIEFSNHFWNRFERRKNDVIELTIELIKDTVLNPDFTVEDIKPNREGRIKKINGRCLKVIVEVEKDKLKIITVFWDRTLRRKGLCK